MTNEVGQYCVQYTLYTYKKTKSLTLWSKRCMLFLLLILDKVHVEQCSMNMVSNKYAADVQFKALKNYYQVTSINNP